MQITLTREEMITLLVNGIKEQSWGKDLEQPKITFINKKIEEDEIDVEFGYPITHITIEDTKKTQPTVCKGLSGDYCGNSPVNEYSLCRSCANFLLP